MKKITPTTTLNNQSLPGQTIIEVLIATAVVAMVLTTVVAALSLSVRNSSQSRFRILAANQTQEALEQFRRFRDRLGWDSFYAVMSVQNGRYCINTLPNTKFALDELQPGECQSGVPIAGTSFEREVVVSSSGSPEEIVLTIEVSWQDGEITRVSTLTQEFRDIR